MLTNTTEIHELKKIGDFEKVIYFHSQNHLIRGIIAIHNTANGPALGGCRLYSYPNFKTGLNDALLLAEAMTYKNTLMDLPYGGGKAVIFQNNNTNKTDILDAFSQALNHLNGEYLTADDIGTTIFDMEYLRKSTPYAKGILYNGNQIPATSYGVYQSIKAALYHEDNLDSLLGVKVVVQGLGKVGYELCKYLYKDGCKLYVDDCKKELVAKATKNFNAEAIKIDEVNNIKADVFSPCALGGTINKNTLSRLGVKYIVGGANNQLAYSKIANILHGQGILYIPDYLCNAGGVIDICCEGKNYTEEYVLNKVSKIYDKTLEVLRLAKLENKTPLEVANQYVRNQLKEL